MCFQDVGCWRVRQQLLEASQHAYSVEESGGAGAFQAFALASRAEVLTWPTSNHHEAAVGVGTSTKRFQYQALNVGGLNLADIHWEIYHGGVFPGPAWQLCRILQGQRDEAEPSSFAGLLAGVDIDVLVDGETSAQEHFKAGAYATEQFNQYQDMGGGSSIKIWPHRTVVNIYSSSAVGVFVAPIFAFCGEFME
jgi:hypothetical protein